LLFVAFILHCFPVYVDPDGKYETLEKYGNDLTELARRGKLDPVIGRDDEIRSCIQILSRRTKNNPVIIGEPGVGKTAIAEGYVFRSMFSLWGNFASS
jgi:ATP-dependent Clp protease ATP-binding subunit ClpB